MQIDFQHVLPPKRLGKSLESVEAFEKATHFRKTKTTKVKEYSIVVVTQCGSQRRIMLGEKHRGFGKGFFNSVGGKKENNETIDECACRELQEEAGIDIPLHVMAQSQVGSMHYTFEDQKDFLMICHVFLVDIGGEGELGLKIDPSSIRGCDEITPRWFDSFSDIPFDKMFADDSLWLTRLLEACSQGNRLAIDGWFHFLPGGQEINSIRHYYMDIRPKTFSLEKRLFHHLCCSRLHNTTVKEFKEGWAFCKAVKSIVGGRKHQPPLEVVFDVAGGHGALAALFLITTSAKRAVVIDPAQVGNGSIQRAWGDEFLRDKELRYLHEDLRIGLPASLSNTLQSVDPERVLVVACHACQHLSEEVLEIVCTQFPGVHAAVMPCCQRDTSPGCAWKQTSKNLEVPIELAMDFLLAGKAMSWQVGQSASYEYDVRMKVIDRKITPQNRIIVCKARKRHEQKDGREVAHQKLAKTYARAHGLPRSNQASSMLDTFCSLTPSQIGSVCGILGFAAGIWVAGLSCSTGKK